MPRRAPILRHKEPQPLPVVSDRPRYPVINRVEIFHRRGGAMSRVPACAGVRGPPHAGVAVGQSAGHPPDSRGGCNRCPSLRAIGGPSVRNPCCHRPRLSPVIGRKELECDVSTGGGVRKRRGHDSPVTEHTGQRDPAIPVSGGSGERPLNPVTCAIPSRPDQAGVGDRPQAPPGAQTDHIGRIAIRGSTERSQPCRSAVGGAADRGVLPRGVLVDEPAVRGVGERHLHSSPSLATGGVDFAPPPGRSAVPRSVQIRIWPNAGDVRNPPDGAVEELDVVDIELPRPSSRRDLRPRPAVVVGGKHAVDTSDEPVPFGVLARFPNGHSEGCRNGADRIDGGHDVRDWRSFSRRHGRGADRKDESKHRADHESMTQLQAPIRGRFGESTPEPRRSDTPIRGAASTGERPAH